MPPLIGITCGVDGDRHYITRYYSEGVQAAGGLPVLLPPLAGANYFDYYYQALDGLILAGGSDVDPVHFGEEPSPGLGEICPERDAFELGLAKCFLNQPKPILAICRGMQVLNIAAGGSVWQHIPEKPATGLKHKQDAPKWYPTHIIELTSGSRLESLFLGKNQVRVNSFHHQAVRALAKGFQACARARDGVIEAMESSTYKFWVGVQWHPECMWEKEELQLELFKGLVAACVP